MTADAQSAIHASEPLDLRMLIETIPAMVVCALPDGSVEFANHAWQEYTGASLQQLRGSGWQTAIHPDDVRGFVEEWNANLPTGPLATEARMRRADGQYHWFLIRKALAIPPNRGSNSSLRTLIACEDINERKQAEARLHQSETQLQAFFENSPSVIFLKDLEGRYLYANREFKRARGITEAHINGKTDNELFPAEQASVFQASDRQVREAGAPIEFEQVTVEKDGQHTSIVQKFPLFNADGEIYAIGGIVTDITERKREESARRYSEERHRLIVETATDAVVSIDESSVIVFANPATARVFGYDPKELIGKPLTVLMPAFMRNLHETGFRRYLATGQRHMNWQGTELTALRKSGEEFPVEVSFGELTRDGHKVFTGFLRDISEKKRAEESLRRSESYLAEAQKLAHIGSWAWEMAGRSALYISEEWYRIYGLDPKEGMPSWEQRLQRIHPEDRARFQATIDRAIAEKSDYDVEFRILSPDSPGKYIHSVGHPILGSSGELVQFVGVSMDVTESKRVEEERERLRQVQADLVHINRVSTMGELTASLAHEIKQPIGAAVTNAEVCLRLLDRDQPDVPDAREAALEMAKDARRAAEIIERVRSLYQKGSSRLELVDVNEVIAEMLILLRSEANRHSVTMRTDLAEGLPQVIADRVQLQQVLMNLMLNGIEAMRDNGGELSIKSQSDEDGQLLISVADTGMGLRAEDVDKIFNAFFTTKSQGTGLGLSITRSILESHGGTVWAAANSGRGTTFHFTLPIKTAGSA